METRKDQADFYKFSIFLISKVAFMIHVTFLSIDVIIIIQRGDANVFI